MINRSESVKKKDFVRPIKDLFFFLNSDFFFKLITFNWNLYYIHYLNGEQLFIQKIRSKKEKERRNICKIYLIF